MSKEKTMSETKLKPCPFCGDGVVLTQSHVRGEGIYILHMTKPCGMSVDGSLSPDHDNAFIAAWNTRTPDAALAASHKGLYEALRDVLGWAGKDKRRMARRGWTLEKEMVSLNRAASALLAAEALTGGTK